jgi:hypothetical protein
LKTAGGVQERLVVEPSTLRSEQDSNYSGAAIRPRPARDASDDKQVPAPASAMNRPLLLEPELPAPPRSATAALAENIATAATPQSPPGPRTPSPAQAVSRDRPAEIGKVWVKVPRSYYFHISRLTNHKELPVEEMQKLVVRTEEQIKTGIALVVPLTGPTAWSTKIDMIPDDVPLERPPVVTPTWDARRIAMDWGIAGAMGALAAALVMFASWILSSRRLSAMPESASRKVRYHEGSSLAPGPSERVREFVRLNPESAVSVLERWTSQGGDVS